MQVNASSVSLSQQDLQFCPDVQRSCYDNSDFKTALNRLVKGNVVAYDCLPYTVAQSDDPAKLCNYRCQTPPTPATQGKFGFSPLRDPVAAQKHIRRYNSFVTRFNLYSDFFDWSRKVADKEPTAVYSCPNTDKTPEEAQAVAVVGYDNKAGYWLVKNRWEHAAAVQEPNFVGESSWQQDLCCQLSYVHDPSAADLGVLLQSCAALPTVGAPAMVTKASSE